MTYLSQKFLRCAMHLWLMALFLSNFLGRSFLLYDALSQMLFCESGAVGRFFPTDPKGSQLFYFPCYF